MQTISQHQVFAAVDYIVFKLCLGTVDTCLKGPEFKFVLSEASYQFSTDERHPQQNKQCISTHFAGYIVFATVDVALPRHSTTITQGQVPVSSKSVGDINVIALEGQCIVSNFAFCRQRSE